jgi:hypothetical protein
MRTGRPTPFRFRFGIRRLTNDLRSFNRWI